MSRVRAGIVVVVLFVAAVASLTRARVVMSVRCHAASTVVQRLLVPAVWGNSDAPQ